MPTILTGAKWLALAEKKFADPPRTFSALPNGVSTESRATEPTTRSDMWVGGMSSRARSDSDAATELLFDAVQFGWFFQRRTQTSAENTEDTEKAKTKSFFCCLRRLGHLRFLRSQLGKKTPLNLHAFRRRNSKHRQTV